MLLERKTKSLKFMKGYARYHSLFLVFAVKDFSKVGSRVYKALYCWK
jgi:hypothetical protein